MTAHSEPPTIGLDQPLQVGDALKRDKLDRGDFARTVATSLRRVTSTAGFVLSVEGQWGSGKTSTLAMIQEVLANESERTRPIAVHFNPWLVGERDVLLRHFFAKLASAVKLADHAKDGKKVAKELKTYAKAFDVLKLIPGAEPWASIVKSVLVSVGDTTESVAEYKTPDIEVQKGKVEDALRKFPRPIVIFIDDIDRLFPREVFEMIRIIKAIGDLPNVGYVLAWDPAYVSRALENASVPQAESYLDKIVQVRMPLPGLSVSARGNLINEALASLEPEALVTHFPRDNERLSTLYFSGLRELLEQPRDVTRVFNAVSVFEPALRGEVVFSDIVGLCALMVKATSVFELLRKQPRWFVGRLPGEHGLLDKNEDILKEGSAQREAAYAKCSRPDAVKQVVHRLFPLTAKAEDAFAIDRVVDIEGHLAAPARLLVALQMSVSASDVSLVYARRYLVHPEQRTEIEQKLDVRNSLEFMESLGDVAESIEGRGIPDLENLCLAIARLADREPFPARSKERSGFFAHPAENVALRAIDLLVKTVNPQLGPGIAATLVEDEYSVSVAAQLLVVSYLSDRAGSEDGIACLPSAKQRLMKQFGKNVVAASKRNALLQGANPGFVLWNLARASRSSCAEVLKLLRTHDASLDGFALEILRSGFDSNKGQTYALPKDIDVLEAYCTLDDFRTHARARLADPSITLPASAAWQAVVDGKPYYGKDGSLARR